MMFRDTQTAFIESIRAGDSVAVSTLLQAGVDVNAVAIKQHDNDYEDGHTPLTVAAKLGNAPLLRCLLEHGADVLQASIHSQTFGCTALMYAADSGNYPSVKLLLAWGAHVNAKSRYGSTALMWAAYRGHNLVVRLLLRKGADINAYMTRSNGITTPLTEAVRGGHDITVSLLLKQGARQTGEEGRTALMISQASGYRAITKILKSEQRNAQYFIDT